MSLFVRQRKDINQKKQLLKKIPDHTNVLFVFVGIKQQLKN
jgi:hypothetical protein